MSYAVRIIVLITACMAGVVGCGIFEKPASPPPLEYTLTSPYHGVRTFAVAPAVNLSGSKDFDPLAVSDSLFDELQQVQRLNVLPLNKTLIMMRRMGLHGINDPQTAQALARSLGADGLIVPAVTAYDPYNPPVMGMTLQLYTSGPPGEEPTGQGQPEAQVSAVFNATNQSVLRELRDFASGRTQYDSALQDQKYLMDADAYMRFVCHAMIRRLLEVESGHPNGR